MSALRPGYEQTEVGLIPGDWKVCTIGSICQLINGRGFKPFEWSDQGLPIIRIQNLNGSDDFNYFEGSYNRKIEVETDQLLFAWSGSRGTSFGPHIWSGPKAVLNYHTWKLVHDDALIDKAYFLHGLRRLTAEIEASAHGASALVHTQKKEMEGFHLAVPPLPEQQAISEALGDADGLIEALEALIAKKRAIKQGAMQDLLTGHRRLPGFERESGQPARYKQSELGTIPDDWDVAEIRHHNVKVGSGLTPTGGSKVYINEGRPFVRSQNVGWGCLLLDDLSHISEETHQTFTGSEIRAGDILLNITGASIGRAALADQRIHGGNVNQHVCIIRTTDISLYPEYLIYYLLSGPGQRKIDSFQAGGNRQGLNFEQVRSFILPLPPLPEQRAIAIVLSEMNAEIAALEDKLAKARAVKQGKMQVLLTGEIRLI